MQSVEKREIGGSWNVSPNYRTKPGGFMHEKKYFSFHDDHDASNDDSRQSIYEMDDRLGLSNRDFY